MDERASGEGERGTTGGRVAREPWDRARRAARGWPRVASAMAAIGAVALVACADEPEGEDAGQSRAAQASVVPWSSDTCAELAKRRVPEFRVLPPELALPPAGVLDHIPSRERLAQWDVRGSVYIKKSDGRRFRRLDNGKGGTCYEPTADCVDRTPTDSPLGCLIQEDWWKKKCTDVDGGLGGLGVVLPSQPTTCNDARSNHSACGARGGDGAMASGVDCVKANQYCDARAVACACPRGSGVAKETRTLPDGTVIEQGTCIDTATNTAFCGASQANCAAMDGICIAGSCTCKSDTDVILTATAHDPLAKAGGCVDPMSNPFACGAKHRALTPADYVDDKAHAKASALRATSPGVSCGADQMCKGGACVAVPKWSPPWGNDDPFLVRQGWNGSFSHSFEDDQPCDNRYGARFAIDYQGAGDSLGRTVYAVADGTVVAAVHSFGTGGCDPSFANSANHVVIEHTVDGKRFYGVYWHLSSDAVVQKGDAVHAGQPVGTIGLSGYVCGAHLHFQLQRAWTGTHCADSDWCGGTIPKPPWLPAGYCR